MNASRTTARAAAALVMVLTAGSLAACGGESSGAGRPDSTVAGRAVKVTATTNFVADTVREVGGDRVEVTGLMGPGVDPHLYKASARDVRTLRQADLIVYGGLQLEGKMEDLLEQLAERQSTLAVTKDLPRGELLAPPKGAKEEADPHVWFDPAKWKVAARTVAEALKAKNPEGAAEFDRNLERYLAELDATDRYVAERIESIPRARRVLVTSHDAFEYFGRRYGMQVAGIQGISTAAEATTADVRRVAELIAQRRVPAVFVESSVPRQTIDAVLAAARRDGAEVQVGEELFTDAAGEEGTPEGTYVGMLRANADRIAAGLGAGSGA